MSYITIVLSLLGLLIGNTANVASAPTFQKPKSLPDEKLKFSESISTFSFNLLRDFNNEIPNRQNLLFSPLALSRAFLLLRDLTSNQSRSRLEALPRCLELNETVLNSMIAKIAPSASSNDQSFVSIRNLLFYNASLAVGEETQDIVNRHQSNIPAISHNNNKIGKMILQDGNRELASEYFDLMMLNELDFRSWWKQAFNQVEEHDFMINEDKTVKIPLMSIVGSFNYSVSCKSHSTMILDVTGFDCVSNDQAPRPDILEVPFGNDNLVMVFIASNDHYPLRKIEENIGNELATWRSNLENSRSRIMIPKFKFYNEMNIKEMFDFNDISLTLQNSTRQKLSLSEFYHTVSLEINEQGDSKTEEQGNFFQARLEETSEVLVVLKALEPSVIYRTIKINRPFVFIIEDRILNVPVVVGKITDPSEFQKSK